MAVGETIRPLPLSLIPLVLYGVGAFFAWDFGDTTAVADAAASLWDGTFFSIHLVSGEVFPVTVANGLVALAGVTLFLSITRTAFGTFSVLANMLAVIVLGLYVVMFLVAAPAATDTFFTLMVLAFVDTIAGIAVAMTRRSRGPRVVYADQTEPEGGAETTA